MAHDAISTHHQPETQRIFPLRFFITKKGEEAMLIFIHPQATGAERAALLHALATELHDATPTSNGDVIGVDATALTAAAREHLAALPAVARIVPVRTAYKLVSRAANDHQTQVRVGTVIFGAAGPPPVIAGPCSVENEAQIIEAAYAAKAAGASMLRGGAFKPRTSPYSFQGLGLAGLRMLATARDATGLPIVTEVMEPGMVDAVAAVADMLQIGARNMQNFALLVKAGQSGKPILLKRGPSSTIEEWLLAAEYIVATGNPNVVLCERGIRSFDPLTRNVLDVAAIPLAHSLTHLPVVADPSHGTGSRALVAPMALAAVAAGADGLIIEMHPHPDQSLSDAAQTISPAALHAIITASHALHATLAQVASNAPPTTPSLPTNTAAPRQPVTSTAH
jgi:3-deoxy-7-phosphoheptulonate synthase